MKQWKNRHRIIRAIIQIGFFLLYSGAWAAAFGGVRYILGQIHLVEPIEFNGLVKTLAVLVLMTIIMGRFFCGYACAFGTLGDGVYGLSCWIQKNVLKRKKPFSFSKKTIIISQKIKYVLLAGILIFCFLGKYDLISSLDPWGTFSTITTGQFAFGTMKLGVVIFLFVLLGMALMERFFCQVLCPMGAIFAILPYLPMSVLRRNREACISGCALCEVKCPVKLALDPENNQLGECIQCGKCVDLCPKKHITFGIKKLKPTGMAAISLQTLLLAAGLIWAIYS